jgi:hypothetical protein
VSGHLINAGTTSYTTAVQNIQTYQSYALQAQAWSPLMGTIGNPLVVEVTLNFWADAAATLLLYSETYWAWLGSTAANAATIPLMGSGPLYGAYMTVTFTTWPVGAGVGTITISSIQLYGTGRPLADPDFRQVSPFSAGIASNGVSLPAAGALTSPVIPIPGTDDNICLENNTPLAANSTIWIPLPLISGAKASAAYSTSAALNNSFVWCSAAGLTSGSVIAGTGSHTPLWSVGAATLSGAVEDLNLGRAPSYIVLRTTAAAISWSFLAATT